MGHRHRPATRPTPEAFGPGVPPWRSARMARRSSPGASTRRRGCGTPPPASHSARPWPIRTMRDSVAFSPDGRTILTGERGPDGAAVGRRHRPADRPAHAASSQDRSWGSAWRSARMVGSCSRVITSTARLWDAPAPLPDDLPRLAAWVEAVTGMELDERGSIHVLDRAAWLERRRRLEQLGGPPPADRRRGWTRSSSAPIRRRGATPGRSGASGTGPRPPTPRRSAPARSTDRSGRPWPACTSSAAIPTGPRRRSPRRSG